MYKRVRFPGAILVSVVCVLAGCDQAHQTQATPTPQPSSPPQSIATIPSAAPKELSTDDAQTSLKLSDLVMERDHSVLYSTSGDLRPFWVVSGRITNQDVLTVTSVRLHLEVADKTTGHDLDSAVLNIKEEIPPLATVSFRRVVQLMIPARGWSWICLVDSATVKQ